MRRLLWGLALLPLTFGVACSGGGGGDGADGGTGNDGGGGGDGGTCTTSSTSTVTITIAGLPSGVNASVDITGPDGSTQTVTQSGPLTLPSGAYKFRADIVTQTDPIVRTAYKPDLTTEQDKKLCDGDSLSLTVTYTAIPTSNKIWWGNQDGTDATLGYASASLAATGSPAADIAASTDNAVAGEFDPEGNLWAIDGVSKSIKRFTADSLATGGTKTADIEITGDELTGGVPGPATLTFDSKGNLYVGITFSKTIVRFDHESIGASGAPAPNATITVPDVASSIAFDKNGLLWAACANNRVVSLSHAHDTGAVTAAPDVSIDAMTPTPSELTAPAGLAFDADGNLWVDYNGTFAKLSAADQSGTGDKTVTPAVQVVSDVLTLPGGMSFDESGGLWYAYTSGKFAKLSAAQLTTSSTAAPSVIITSSNVVYALNPALYPAPKALPLYSALQK